jgi:hypothetical protein
MKSFKGKKTPPISENFKGIQNEYCQGSGKCIDDCKDCLYDQRNIGKFVEFLKSTKKPIVTNN